MIRDPRDVVISGYYYHLHSKEAWLQKPQSGFNGMSFQQKLLSVDKSEGLMLEMNYATRITVREMMSWNYNNPAILELKYEEVICEPDLWFPKLFQHYGFSGRTLAVALDAASKNAFATKSGRAFGETKDGEHMRSGTSGQWRLELEQIHLDYMKEEFADCLTRLGYETTT